MLKSFTSALLLAVVTALAPMAQADGYARQARGSIKDPVYAPPAFSWTGFYVGANLGIGWGDTEFDTFAGGAWTPGQAGLIGQGMGNSLNGRGFTGGMQFGYNRQTGEWVWGIETDINFIDSSQTQFGGAIAGTPITSFRQSAAVNWMGSLRGRLGVAIDQVLLVYLTGGLAYADWEHRVIMAQAGALATSSSSGVEVGWVIGAGLEYAVAPAWSLRAEYLYSEYGVATGRSAFPAGFTQRHEFDLTTQVVRAGLNYKF